MPIAEANGIDICYEVTGTGPPLLLVMGLGGQLTDWPDGLVDQLGAHFTVIRFDNRDSGLSAHFTSQPPSTGEMVRSQLTRKKITSEYLLADMAADAIGVLDLLDIDKAHVCGMSMGGMIAQTIAIEHPERTLSLTSIMSNTGDNKNGNIAPKLMAKLARRPNPTRETAVDDSVAMFEMIGGSSWNAAEHRARSILSVERAFSPAGTGRQLAAIKASPDRTPALKRLGLPTLVVHGLSDPLVRPSGGIATANAVPGARLLMFPDMGHDLPATRWSELTEAICTNATRASDSAPIPQVLTPQ